MMKIKASLVSIFIALVITGCSAQSDNRSSSTNAYPSPSRPEDIAPPSSEREKIITPIVKTPPSTPVQAVKGPRIAFTADSADWGRVPYNTQIEQVYEFENVGSDVLQLIDIPTISVVEGC